MRRLLRRRTVRSYAALSPGQRTVDDWAALHTPPSSRPTSRSLRRIDVEPSARSSGDETLGRFSSSLMFTA